MTTLQVACAQQTRSAATAGTPGNNELLVVQEGKTSASIVVAADAGTWEKRAAEDLQKYIEMMTGAKPALGETAAGNGPALYVGKAALEADKSLQAALNGVLKKTPLLRADGIVARRDGNRVLLAGSNDESHYFAVSWLLQQWGARWYLPTEFGEVIPERSTLKIGTLNYAYAPPFEIRHYWIAWTGSQAGATEFRRRNFMTETSMVGMGHALGHYTKDLAPAGGSIYNIPFSDPKTAEHVAAQIEKDYAAGKSISLAIEDGNYVNDSPSDKALIVEWDKYTLKPSLTDAMLTFYNNVGKILREKYPNSKAKIGGMAYANVTIPPKVVKHIEPNVVMWIAPIDIDPIHHMDDPKSPPRQEYRDMMHRWAELVGGRLAIYDYDQGMLVWRDIPNPAHRTFAHDVKHYQKAGILGIGTESRNAIATVFTNLYFRGQLMWNPDRDISAMETEFYQNFYGPAAKPMGEYWDAIYDAWDNTPATEHEYFVAPAVYTPELVGTLRTKVAEAQKIVAPLRGKANPTRNEKLYLLRIDFTQNSFDVIENYMNMVRASAAEVDFKAAAEYADKGLAARDAFGKYDPSTDFDTTKSSIFTSLVNEGTSAAWWKGEPAFMRELQSYTDGTKGTLIAKTPLQWAWKSEAPVPDGWTYAGMEGATPKNPNVALATQAPTAANGWKMLGTDIYLQGQGVLAPDGQSYTGHYWYQTTLDLKADQTHGKLHLMFPGLFNEAWLYVNGELVAHRPYNEPWWLTDYKFMFDADLSGKLKPGKNTIAIRGFNPHHFGGIFRRPFLYRATQ